jgi:uncharacterized repeat protein (TIGR03803 family)
VIFKVTPEGDFTVVHRLKGGLKGQYPVGPVLIGANGKLYTTTLAGGFENHGVLLNVPSNGGNETLLHKFGHVTTTGADGYYPSGRLVQDSTGNIYGTTQGGGVNNRGVVFRYGADGSYRIVHAFDDSGGIIPTGLTIDSSNNLYGTTEYSGRSQCPHCGTVYRITPDGTTTTLYAFGTKPNDGFKPFDADLVEDPAGNLYGTTPYGGRPGCVEFGTNCGTVFKVSSSGVETILHRFTGTDGGNPKAGLLLFKNHLYGTTASGGAHNAGTIFRLDLPKT